MTLRYELGLNGSVKHAWPKFSARTPSQNNARHDLARHHRGWRRVKQRVYGREELRRPGRLRVSLHRAAGPLDHNPDVPRPHGPLRRPASAADGKASRTP
eukprot:5982368-Prymnesium_polylepis.1